MVMALIRVEEKGNCCHCRPGGNWGGEGGGRALPPTPLACASLSSTCREREAAPAVQPTHSLLSQSHVASSSGALLRDNWD